MDIRNCKRCGKVFQYTGKSICAECILKDDEDYKIIRDYIQEHHNATPLEISERTKVELKTITRFLREGRLEAEGIDTSEMGLECEKCGREISSGRYCEACLNELQSEFQAAAGQLGAAGTTEKRIKPRESAQTLVHTYDNILNRKR